MTRCPPTRVKAARTLNIQAASCRSGSWCSVLPSDQSPLFVILPSPPVTSSCLVLPLYTSRHVSRNRLTRVWTVQEQTGLSCHAQNKYCSSSRAWAGQTLVTMFVDKQHKCSSWAPHTAEYFHNSSQKRLRPHPTLVPPYTHQSLKS